MLRQFTVPVLVLLAAAPAAFGESPDPASLTVPPELVAKARDLVRQLGSPVYRDRDRATRELARMGRLALPALAVAATAEDTEVSHRAAWLLARAEADDLRAKVEAFLADTGGKYRHDLPGWDALRGVAGDDQDSRALFAEIVKNPGNRDVLLALRPDMDSADREVELTRAIAARRQAIYLQGSQPLPNGGFVYRVVTPELPVVALLFLAESLVTEKRLPVGGYYYNPANYLNLPAAKELMAGRGSGSSDAVFRKLVLRWLDTRDGPQGTYAAMNAALNLNLAPETITRYAARVLTTDGNSHFYRYRAAALIAQHGGKQHLPALTKLFGDDTRLLFAQNGQAEVQVRDFALAMALVLTGQDPKAYGLDAQQGANAALRFSYTYHRFYPDDKVTTDQKRAAAFAKWRGWEAAVYGSAAGPAAVAAEHVMRYAEKPAAK